MTAQALDARAFADDADARVFRVFLAPLGWHTRYMLRAYLQHIFVVALGLVAIALSIDLTPQIAKLLGTDAAGGKFEAAFRIAWFAALRTSDLLPRFLAFATFLGVLWVELSHTQSRERIAIWNSGRSPIQCLTPVLLVGLIVGGLQVACDFYLRPEAMRIQISQHLGSYGDRYNRHLSQAGIWISAGNDLVHARIEYEPPRLHDLTIYRLDAKGRILEVDSARTAAPIPAGMGNGWLLMDGSFWSAGTRPPRDRFAPAGNRAPTENADIPFTERSVELKIDPLWLSTYGISPIFLRQGTLEALAASSNPSVPTGMFRTWVQAKYGQALLPGLMALLASTLSLLTLAYRTRAEALLGIILAGYMADLAMRMFLLLGEHGFVAPVVAGWFVPLALLASSVVLLVVTEARRSLRERRQVRLGPSVT